MWGWLDEKLYPKTDASTELQDRLCLSLVSRETQEGTIKTFNAVWQTLPLRSELAMTDARSHALSQPG